jgi:malate dehydrogenase
MSFIAIIGAGPIGGSLAHKLAQRGRVKDVRLIDDSGAVAQGKALDILQASPVEGFSTRVTGTDAINAAAGAAAIVIADPASGHGEHSGEAALALVRHLAAIEMRAPIVCAGASQRDLIARATGELGLAPARAVGSAPFALESALRALAGVWLDGSGVEVTLRVVGVPPRSAVVAWEESTANGQPLASELAPHHIAALSARIPGLWPPGPYALGSAAARVVEAIANGSRRRYSCFVTLRPGTVIAMPVELGSTGVTRIVEPTLTRQERTRMENAMEEQSIADRRLRIVD